MWRFHLLLSVLMAFSAECFLDPCTTIPYISFCPNSFKSYQGCTGLQMRKSAVTLPGETRDMAFFFLKEELKLEDATMIRIIRSHSWLLYLNVETNLKPTIECLNSFGFRQKDIQQLVDRAPSILAIDCVWTMPEKLVSLQRMFALSRSNLVRLVVEQPLLLTSSVERNMDISTFLTDEVGLSYREMNTLVMKHSKVTMTNRKLLSSCWSTLLVVYGLSTEEARKLIIRQPSILSNKLLVRKKERVKFFSDLGLPVSGEECRQVVLRFPQILYIGTTSIIYDKHYQEPCISVQPCRAIYTI